MSYLLDLIAADGGLGWFAYGGMSEVPLSFQEINAFRSTVAPDLRGWECQALRALSDNYVAGNRLGQNACTRAPAYETDAEDSGLSFERKTLSDGLEDAFDKMIAAQAARS